MNEQPRFGHTILPSIANLQAIGGTSEVHIHFKDNTVLSFQASADGPRMRGTGGPEGWAKKFYENVQEFKFLPTGVAFVFKDTSEINFDLKGVKSSTT
jgi:hypothetical protein